VPTHLLVLRGAAGDLTTGGGGANPNPKEQMFKRAADEYITKCVTIVWPQTPLMGVRSGCWMLAMIVPSTSVCNGGIRYPKNPLTRIFFLSEQFFMQKLLPQQHEDLPTSLLLPFTQSEQLSRKRLSKIALRSAKEEEEGPMIRT